MTWWDVLADENVVEDCGLHQEVQNVDQEVDRVAGQVVDYEAGRGVLRVD